MTQAQVDEKRLLEAAQKAAQEVENYYHSSQYPPLKKVTDRLQKELNLDFLLDDNAVQKAPPSPPKKKTRKRSNNYSQTKVKTRNFLTNFCTIVSKMKILTISCSWSTVMASYCYTSIRFKSSENLIPNWIENTLI